MNLNGDGVTRNDKPSAVNVNPGHIVIVRDLSPETLRNVIAHLEVSTDFEHLVYREAELDAIWSITEFLLGNPFPNEGEALIRLHAEVHRAHDLVAESRPHAAAALLRTFLS
jgi:hypothetical protein